MLSSTFGSWIHKKTNVKKYINNNGLAYLILFSWNIILADSFYYETFGYLLFYTSQFSVVDLTWTNVKNLK